MQLDLVLVGFGNVARRFVRLLEERAERLEREHGLTWRVVGIATRRHGIAHRVDGLDVGAALELVERGASLEVLDDGSTPPVASALDLIARVAAMHEATATGRLVMVETTMLNVEWGQPATSHVEAALEARVHVISSNKGPVAFAYRRLRERAGATGRAFLFEGAVMDGIPIFNLVRETMPAVEVRAFRGVVNSTTNYILSAMEEGREFGEALAEMQTQGIAEADASLDVDGWDAAAKTAALVNVLMRGDVTPHAIERTGIGKLTRAEVRAAADRKKRIRLVATAGRQDGRIVARVAPSELPETDLLAQLRGMENALVLSTDLLGEVAVLQLTSGLTQTAYALVSDLVAVRRRLGSA